MRGRPCGNSMANWYGDLRVTRKNTVGRNWPGKKKFTAAEELYKQIAPDGELRFSSHIYPYLEAAGYYWSSKKGWQKRAGVL